MDNENSIIVRKIVYYWENSNKVDIKAIQAINSCKSLSCDLNRCEIGDSIVEDYIIYFKEFKGKLLKETDPIKQAKFMDMLDYFCKCHDIICIFNNCEFNQILNKTN